jgi:PKHD-type hydroxylase
MTKKLIDPLSVSYSWGLFDQKEKHSILTNIRSIFTPEECERINSYGLIKYADELRDAHVVPTPTFSKFDQSIRSSRIVMFPSTDGEIEWVFRAITDAILSINKKFYEYDLSQIEILQFTSYDYKSKGFYKPHVDTQVKGDLCRKLSFSIQLSPPDAYTGGDLIFNMGNPEIASKEQGIGLFFPSWVLHEVTPVITGIRTSLVGWVVGPHFK